MDQRYIEGEHFLHQDTYDALRLYADNAEYVDKKNEKDDVIYPHICEHVPFFVQMEVQAYLEHTIKRRLENIEMFLRMSPKGVVAPHRAHHDASMGRYSLMLYLNRPEHCKGGTELLRHLEHNIEAGCPLYNEAIYRDSNDDSKWEVYHTCEMAPNKVFIFDSELIHRAAPLGGFGTTKEDSRLVLTAFFD